MKLNHTIVAIAVGMLIGLAWQLWRAYGTTAIGIRAAMNGAVQHDAAETISSVVE